MLGTHFRRIRLPEPYGSRLGYEEMSCGELSRPSHYPMVLEFIAWLKGELADPNAVAEVLALCNRMELKEELEKVKPLPSYVIPTDIVVNSNDGGSVHAVTATLRRHFHFFDDYISEFSVREVSVPFSEEVIRTVLKMDRDSPYLVDHLNCIRYLNPKDPFFYFTFDTEGTSPDTIREIAELCSMKDRKDVMMASGSKMSYRYDLGFLVSILKNYNDIENIKALFSDSPSYLALLLSSMLFPRDTFYEHMLTSDFSLSDEVDHFINREWIEYAMKNLLLHCKEWSEMQRWIAMMNCHSSLFGTDKMYVTAPYHVCLSFHRLSSTVTRGIATKIQEFIPATNADILAALHK